MALNRPGKASDKPALVMLAQEDLNPRPSISCVLGAVGWYPEGDSVSWYHAVPEAPDIKMTAKPLPGPIAGRSHAQRCVAQNALRHQF